MSKADDIVKKMKQGINNVSFRDLEKLLRMMGYELDRQDGSHKVYVKPQWGHIVLVETRPMRAYMVKMVIRRYEEEKMLSEE